MVGEMKTPPLIEAIALQVAASFKIQDMRRLPKADPYEAFHDWCMANGFADVMDCEPEDVNLDRLNEAVEAYGKS